MIVAHVSKHSGSYISLLTSKLGDGGRFDDFIAGINGDFSPHGDSWSRPLTELGYGAVDVPYNVEAAQKAWAKENGVRYSEQAWAHDICVAQLNKAGANVLIFRDHSSFSYAEVTAIREACPSVRLVLGWCGAPYHDLEVFKAFDCTLTCIPSFVPRFSELGHQARYVRLAFDPRLLERIDTTLPRRRPFSFIGSIYGSTGLHQSRQAMLEQLVRRTPIELIGQASNVGTSYYLKTIVKIGLNAAGAALQGIGLPRAVVDGIPGMKKAASTTRLQPLSKLLHSRLSPPVFGLEMYRILADTLVSWNCHIDAVGPDAANYRLFEATGLGSCLLTDHKRNMAEMFAPDSEVVTYGSLDECIDKANWLLANPDRAREIGAAGQRRCLAEHTYAHRVAEIDRIIRSLV